VAVSPREAACQHAYRAFPALAGVRPTVRRAGPHRVYTFQKTFPSDGGPAHRQLVRVTVDEGGRIVKVVTAR
jgi:hypothetical protein